MDKQWLSAIVEVQGLIGRRELDVDGTMQLIVDRAQTVANATGVAIALFKGHQLVYRAGSGSAADYVGRHVMATLSVPADTTGGREILRVEDVETDTRIQAEICRQFGAKSLLILLIYHEQSVAGVLEVFFSEAHAFQDCEVRAYRLMAGLIGEAMSQSTHLEREKTGTAPRPAIPNPAIPNPPLRTSPFQTLFSRVLLKRRWFSTILDPLRMPTGVPSSSLAKPRRRRRTGSCQYLGRRPCWRRHSCSRPNAVLGAVADGTWPPRRLLLCSF